MKTLGTKDNFRVVIYPRRMGDLGSIRASDSFFYGNRPEDQARLQRDYEERAKEIADQAKRHCDNVSHVEVICDQEAICEHCGATWTEKDSDYNGGCCEKDEAMTGVKVRDIAAEMGFPSIRKEQA